MRFATSDPDRPAHTSDTWLTPERYRRLQDLVEAASQRPAAERHAFIAAATAADERMCREALALLAASESLGEERSDAEVPPRIGPYRVDRELGHGGMGTVYLARRADESYDKRVAIKLIRPDILDGDEVRARFALERKILASLGHPNIASLIDGGSLDDGRPYIVMEYVDGVPITTYADRARLSPRERIRLFRAVCAGVEHAHHNLVIHRDIKPTNILVTADGTPKLLDFGIAKLLTAGGQDAAQLTASQLNPGTPHYASPEQLAGELVSTAADVYALGVVLFELLTGSWPFDPTDAHSPRVAISPSDAIAGTRRGRRSHDAIGSSRSIAAARGTSAEGLVTQLQGDLDAIVLMALADQVHERYRSVAELSDDLQRHLDDLPVLARPATVLYRAGKFITRNRTSVVASALTVLVLIGGIVSTYYQWQRAEFERQRAERRFNNVRSLAGSVLDVGSALNRTPDSASTRQALVQTSLQYLERLETEAGSDRAILGEVAAGYRRVGDVQLGVGGDPGAANRALSSYRRAVQMSERLAAAEPGNVAARRELAASLERVGTTLTAAGDQQAGLDTLERSLGLYQELLSADRASADAQRDLMHAHVRYADAMAGRDAAAARRSYEQAEKIGEALAARDPESVDDRRDLMAINARLRALDLDTDPALARQQEAQYFEAVRDTQDPARLDYFLQRFPNGAHAEDARRRLAALGTKSPRTAARRLDSIATPDALPVAAAADAPVAPPTTTVTIDLDWKSIPGGRFEMGCDLRPDRVCNADERPRHWVTISRPFRMMATETTIGAYRIYAQATAQAVPNQPAWNTDDRRPLVNATWDQAHRFCLAVGGRLPTEAEWEWAALGGRPGSVHPWGDTYERTKANAGFPGRDGWDTTSPVGTFAPNGYGLFDMAGNVWEWVSDWYGARYYEHAPEADPTGASSGLTHVLRGGAYNTSPVFLRVTQRGVDTMDRRREATGFRCVQ